MSTGNTRPTPTVEHASGMLAALKTSHVCEVACTSTVMIGGIPRRLTCPLSRLRLEDPADRRVIASLYAMEVPRRSDGSAL